MAEAVIMPKTGMAMEEGTIVEWLVKEGDTVSTGDPIVEIETDKSSMEIESDCNGIVLKILHKNGTVVPVVQPIAWIGRQGESIPENIHPLHSADRQDVPEPSVITAVKPTDKIKATPASRRVATEKSLSLKNIQPSGRHGEIREADVHRATPLARRMAESHGVPLENIKGSGSQGKIFSADLKEFPAGSISADHRVPLTNIQKITGRRMLQSHTEIPSVSLDTAADVTGLLQIRKQLNACIEENITINDFVLKATAIALKENPGLNSVLSGDEVVIKSSINLNMAVATDRGLLVPVIKHANNLTLRQISRVSAELAMKGRNGTLTFGDMDGGTFTVSNIGKFGMTSFTPIINQPQAAILGVCAINEKLVLVDGKVEARQMMNLSVNFDHRIVDGAEASIFFSRIRELLETPLVILA